MLKATLQCCVDFLTRRPLPEHDGLFVILHLPLSKCYYADTAEVMDDYVASHPKVTKRQLFRGSVREAAHFVLAPQLSMLVTRDGLPALADNQVPTLEAGDPGTGAVPTLDEALTEPPTTTDEDGAPADVVNS